MPVIPKPPPPKPPLPRLYRARELAEMFGVKQNLIYVWARRGNLPPPIEIAPKSLAWRHDDLEEWLAGRQKASYGSEAGDSK